ncbi:hypothetical protein CD110_03655 [Staphylococcus casei]|uniref:DUF5327 family protein n=1 Tax=Staphylococcus TaxID=1279 RepID=UPI000CD0FECF|nr:DUF5327 family protein [Staphylococcus casei]PNZ61052.1 hypothetical protein CD110_03655 [Staphylococcus casei]WJE86007.1 DUF5327 family protein [Staphylococcus casei]
MEKEKIIQLIEQELVQADEAHNSVEFEKHMYAIHTLTGLITHTSNQTYKDDLSSVSNSFKSTAQSNVDKPLSQTKQEHHGISAEELRAMGGNVTSQAHTVSDTSLSSNKLVTDDEIGNGDSIFDF